MFSSKPMRLTLLSILTAALFATSCNVGATPAPTADVNALSTALVGTTVAQLSVQLTQTAQAVPTNTATPTVNVNALPTFALPTQNPAATTDVSALPTFSFVNTPATGANTAVVLTPVAVLPTKQATASLGDACNNNVFEGDVTVPDGEILKPGVDFEKIWAVKNTGTCTWDDGYELVYIGGSDPNLDPVNFKFKQKSQFVASGQSANLKVDLTTPCTPGKYEGHWRMRSDTGFYFGSILSVYVEVQEKCK